MNREIQAEVVLPPEYAQKPDKRYPVLFAMHGMSASFCRQDVNLSPEKLDEFANQLKLAPLLGSPANNPAAYHAMDLFTGIRAALEKKTVLPPIYLHCGTEDDLLAENRAMHGLLKSKGISFEYLETQGSHDWKFWKEACVGILEFHWKHFAQGLPMESNCR